MSKQVEVTVDALRQASAVLLNHVEEVSGSTVKLDFDLFWSISPDQRNNMHLQPTEFTIGQISESLENLRHVVDDPSEAISYALVWLADALRAVGEAIVA